MPCKINCGAVYIYVGRSTFSVCRAIVSVWWQKYCVCISSPSLAIAGEPEKRHATRAHSQASGSCFWLVESALFGDHVSLRLPWEFSVKFNLFNYLPGHHYINLNRSVLKWCSFINCNWCVSLGIAYILALKNREALEDSCRALWQTDHGGVIWWIWKCPLNRDSTKCRCILFA